MSRVNITEDGHLVGWFDPDKAREYREATRWDGQNMVSINPGCAPYGHQRVLRTSGGRWVLNSWSQVQGTPDVYEHIADAEAREWLLLNEHDAAVAEHLGEIEEERGPGRPEIGGRLGVRLGELRPEVEAWAAEHGVPLAEAVRRLTAAGLRGAGR